MIDENQVAAGCRGIQILRYQTDQKGLVIQDKLTFFVKPATGSGSNSYDVVLCKKWQ